jgi:hypothetical protein
MAPNNTYSPPTFPGSDRDAKPVVSDETTQSFEKLKNTAASAATDLKRTAATAADDAKSYASDVASDAASAFKDAVESNKTAGADAIANLARSAKGAADSIEKQSPQIASAVRSAAESVERISTDIRDRNVGELMDSVTDFAKRQPAAFFGCGILAGMLLTRILRSPGRTN